jgi:hypothetical protein
MYGTYMKTGCYWTKEVKLGCRVLMEGYLDEITVVMEHSPPKSLRYLKQEIRISSFNFILA